MEILQVPHHGLKHIDTLCACGHGGAFSYYISTSKVLIYS